MESGIKFVYTGNVHDTEGQTTFCPSCGHPLLKRDWHDVTKNNLKNGACPKCGTRIPGRFDTAASDISKN